MPLGGDFVSAFTRGAFNFNPSDIHFNFNFFRFLSILTLFIVPFVNLGVPRKGKYFLGAPPEIKKKKNKN